MSGSWLFSRLEGLSNLLVIFTALLAVVNRGNIEPGIVGLSLTYAFTAQLDIFLMTRRVVQCRHIIRVALYQ